MNGAAAAKTASEQGSADGDGARRESRLLFAIHAAARSKSVANQPDFDPHPFVSSALCPFTA